MIIRTARKDEYKTIAQLHKEIFPDFFMTSLGKDYLIGHYMCVLRHPDTICIVADDDGILNGFVLGRVDAKNGLKKVIKAYPFRFSILGLKVLFKKPASLVRVIRNITKKGGKMVADNQDYAEIGLIGVLPGVKRTGLGHKLFETFCKRAVENGAKRVSLTTDYYNNELVLNSYYNWGLKEYYEFTAYPDRRMYRLIKDLI